MDTTGVLSTQSKEAGTEDFLPLLGTDYIEFYVGNAKQSAYYYQVAFGYELVALQFAAMEAKLITTIVIFNGIFARSFFI